MLNIKKNGFTPLESPVPLEKSFLMGFTPLETKGRRKRDMLFLTGFTLVELMLVVIIIGILAAMVIPRLTGRSEEARKGVAKADIDLNIATGLKLYELDNGVFPATEEGLDALLTAPSTAKNWKGPYLEKKPVDPWGNPYRYKNPGTHRTDYDLYSVGRDGLEATLDDVTNWEED